MQQSFVMPIAVLVHLAVAPILRCFTIGKSHDKITRIIQRTAIQPSRYLDHRIEALGTSTPRILVVAFLGGYRLLREDVRIQQHSALRLRAENEACDIFTHAVRKWAIAILVRVL